MPNEPLDPTFSDWVEKDLPYLRRYGRALTGSQKQGDAYTVATLNEILQDRSMIEDAASIKEGLFRCFHGIWSRSGRTPGNAEDGVARRAQEHLATLAVNSREALLLRTIEDFSPEEVGRIIGTDPATVEDLVALAVSDLADHSSGCVMVIEDEPIIASDIHEIVTDLGHKVVGIARTHIEAVQLGRKSLPDLILADIQLADDSSGIDAVNELLLHSTVPVVFITAFPERLLTGEKPEPAFLITKPFSVDQVRSAVSQAMFFASTETLLKEPS